VPHARIPAAAAKKSIKVTFVLPSGENRVVDAPLGDSMLEVAHANNIDIEGECT
jgi:ferredoxin